MVMVKIPAWDIEGEVTRRLKEVLMDAPTFQVTETTQVPYSVGPDGKAQVLFPHVGVDTRTVVFATDITPPNPTPSATDCTGKWEILTPNGLSARFVFNAQPPPLQFGRHAEAGYKRYTTYFLGTPIDMNFNPFTFFGDARAGLKQNRYVPIAVPLVNGFDMQYQTSGGEAAQIYGTMAMYHYGDPAGIKILKAECKKLYQFLKTPDDGSGVNWIADNGFQAFRVRPPVYNFYKDGATIVEALIDFTAFIKIDPTPA